MNLPCHEGHNHQNDQEKNLDMINVIRSSSKENLKTINHVTTRIFNWFEQNKISIVLIEPRKVVLVFLRLYQTILRDEDELRKLKPIYFSRSFNWFDIPYII